MPCSSCCADWPYLQSPSTHTYLIPIFTPTPPHERGSGFSPPNPDTPPRGIQSCRVYMGKGQSRRSEGLRDVFRAHQHKGSIGELRYGVSVLNAGGQGTPYATNTPPKSEIPEVASVTQCGSDQHHTPSKSRTRHSMPLHLIPHAMQNHHT